MMEVHSNDLDFMTNVAASVSELSIRQPFYHSSAGNRTHRKLKVPGLVSLVVLKPEPLSYPRREIREDCEHSLCIDAQK